jgi:mRNA-degrading endonuclease toxin of MazEF toxin-antitoxin module
MVAPDRGDYAHLAFNPQAGHERQGEHFALVLSPRSFNEKTGFAFVAPITSQKKDTRLKPSFLLESVARGGRSRTECAAWTGERVI